VGKNFQSMGPNDPPEQQACPNSSASRTVHHSLGSDKGRDRLAEIKWNAVEGYQGQGDEDSHRDSCEMAETEVPPEFGPGRRLMKF